MSRIDSEWRALSALEKILYLNTWCLLLLSQLALKIQCVSLWRLKQCQSLHLVSVQANYLSIFVSKSLFRVNCLCTIIHPVSEQMRLYIIHKSMMFKDHMGLVYLDASSHWKSSAGNDWAELEGQWAWLHFYLDTGGFNGDDLVSRQLSQSQPPLLYLCELLGFTSSGCNVWTAHVRTFYNRGKGSTHWGMTENLSMQVRILPRLKPTHTFCSPASY